MAKTKMKSATIVDVANLADVSISTVSRVINGRGGVSEELENHVQEAIRALNYHPNTVAQALKSKSTHLIGVIIPSISNPIFSQMARGYEEQAEKYGYSLIISSSDSSLEKEVKCLQTMVRRQVDGIIFNGLGVYDKRLRIVQEAKIPVVFIGKRMEEFPCDNVTLNNKRGAYIAVNHMIKTGAKRIGFIFGKHESVSATEDRFSGYREALLNNGLEYDEDIVIRANNLNDDGGKYATNKLLTICPDLDAIFVSNDLMALGCLEQLKLSGKKVPEEISVMSCDGIPYGRLMTPSLSTMDIPCQEMTGMAIDILVRRIENSNSSYKEIVFETTLHEGGSTKKL